MFFLGLPGGAGDPARALHRGLPGSVPLPRRNAAPATRKHSDPTVKVTTSRISTPLAAAAAGTHQTAKNRPASRCLGSIAMNAPNAIAARSRSNREVPMAVSMRLTRLYYRTRAPFNKPSPSVVRILDQRSTPAHLAPVGLHSGEELLPGTEGLSRRLPYRENLWTNSCRAESVSDTQRGCATTRTSHSSSSLMLFIAALRPGRW